MMRLALESLGHTVTVTGRGTDAIRLARDLQPDVVLCDLGLPEGVTGFEVATVLRAAAETRDIALVAVSGYGQPEDRRRSAAAGFDAHLTKPVSLEDLQAVLRQVGDRA